MIFTTFISILTSKNMNFDAFWFSGNLEVNNLEDCDIYAAFKSSYEVHTYTFRSSDKDVRCIQEQMTHCMANFIFIYILQKPFLALSFSTKWRARHVCHWCLMFHHSRSAAENNGKCSFGHTGMIITMCTSLVNTVLQTWHEGNNMQGAKSAAHCILNACLYSNGTRNVGNEWILWFHAWRTYRPSGL